MGYRNGNYCAFYVAEPFNECSLGAHASKDFVYYNMLKAWKGKDSTFPFNDSHEKTYSVRDGSNWELTLKPRLRERLRSSKNIILFLSSFTKASYALTEEIEYGIDDQGLPVIVIYPEYSSKEDLLYNGQLRSEVKSLWNKVPVFKRLMGKVPTLHIPLNKEVVKQALEETGFKVSTKIAPEVYIYNS